MAQPRRVGNSAPPPKPKGAFVKPSSTKPQHNPTVTPPGLLRTAPIFSRGPAYDKAVAQAESDRATLKAIKAHNKAVVKERQGAAQARMAVNTVAAMNGLPAPGNPFAGVHTGAPARDPYVPDLTAKVGVARGDAQLRANAGLPLTHEQAARQNAAKRIVGNSKALTFSDTHHLPTSLTRPTGNEKLPKVQPQAPAPPPQKHGGGGLLGSIEGAAKGVGEGVASAVGNELMRVPRDALHRIQSPFGSAVESVPGMGLVDYGLGKAGLPNAGALVDRAGFGSIDQATAAIGRASKLPGIKPALDAASLGVGTVAQIENALPESAVQLARGQKTDVSKVGLTPLPRAIHTWEKGLANVGNTAAEKIASIGAPDISGIHVPNADFVGVAQASDGSTPVGDIPYSAGLTPEATLKWRTKALANGWTSADLDGLVGVDLIKKGIEKPPPFYVRIPRAFASGVVRTAAAPVAIDALVTDALTGHSADAAKQLGEALISEAPLMGKHPWLASLQADPYGTLATLLPELKAAGMAGHLTNRGEQIMRVVELHGMKPGIEGSTVVRGVYNKNYYDQIGERISDTFARRTAIGARRVQREVVDRAHREGENAIAPDFVKHQVAYAKAVQVVKRQRAVLLRAYHAAGGDPESMVELYKNEAMKLGKGAKSAPAGQAKFWQKVVDMKHEGLTEADHAFIDAHKNLSSHTSEIMSNESGFGPNSIKYRRYELQLIAKAQKGDPLAQEILQMREELYGKASDGSPADMSGVKAQIRALTTQRNAVQRRIDSSKKIADRALPEEPPELTQHREDLKTHAAGDVVWKQQLAAIDEAMPKGSAKVEPPSAPAAHPDQAFVDELRAAHETNLKETGREGDVHVTALADVLKVFNRGKTGKAKLTRQQFADKIGALDRSRHPEISGLPASTGTKGSNKLPIVTHPDGTKKIYYGLRMEKKAAEAPAAKAEAVHLPKDMPEGSAKVSGPHKTLRQANEALGEHSMGASEGGAGEAAQTGHEVVKTKDGYEVWQYDATDGKPKKPSGKTEAAPAAPKKGKAAPAVAETDAAAAADAEAMKAWRKVRSDHVKSREPRPQTPLHFKTDAQHAKYEADRAAIVEKFTPPKGASADAKALLRDQRAAAMAKLTKKYSLTTAHRGEKATAKAGGKRAGSRVSTNETTLNALDKRIADLNMRVLHAEIQSDPGHEGLQHMLGVKLDEFAAQHMAQDGNIEPARVAYSQPGAVVARKREPVSSVRFGHVPKRQHASTGARALSGEYLINDHSPIVESMQAQRFASSTAKGKALLDKGIPAKAFDEIPEGYVFVSDKSASTLRRVVNKFVENPVDEYDHHQSEFTHREDLVNALRGGTIERKNRERVPSGEKGVLIPKGQYDRVLQYMQPVNRGKWLQFMGAYQRQLISLYPSTLLGNTFGTLPMAFMGGAGYRSFKMAKRTVRQEADQAPHILSRHGLAGSMRRSAAGGNPYVWYTQGMRDMTTWGEDVSKHAMYWRTVLKDMKKEHKDFNLKQADDAQVTFDEYARMAARGEVSHELVDRGLRKANEMLGDNTLPDGRIGHFSAHFIMFHKWLGHVAKLMLVTMPLKHPGALLLMNTLAKYADQWRKAHGVWPSWMKDFAAAGDHIVGHRVFTRAIGLGQLAPQNTAGNFLETLTNESLSLPERLLGLTNPGVQTVGQSGLQMISNYKDPKYAKSVGWTALHGIAYGVPGMAKFAPSTDSTSVPLIHPVRRTYTTGANKSAYQDNHILWGDRPGPRPLGSDAPVLSAENFAGILSRILGFPIYYMPNEGDINDTQNTATELKANRKAGIKSGYAGYGP